MSTRWAAAVVAAVWVFGALLGVGCATARADGTVYELIVDGNGDAQVYACQLYSPPPCVVTCSMAGGRCDL